MDASSLEKVCMGGMNMTAQEMKDYRVGLFRDAVSMTRKPDRLPHLSNFWTWQILDMGYKFSEG